MPNINPQVTPAQLRPGSLKAGGVPSLDSATKEIGEGPLVPALPSTPTAPVGQGTAHVGPFMPDLL